MQSRISQPPVRRRVVQWAIKQSWLKVMYRWIPPSVRQRLVARLVAEKPIDAAFERREEWAAKRLPAAEAPVRLFEHRQAYGAEQGVNVFAYLRGQFGLAECARMYARALLGAGYPAALIDVDLNLPHGLDDRSLDAYVREDAPYGVNLIFVNPDFLAPALEKIGQARLAGKYVIACWFWELENIPEDWLPALALVDEILVSSEYVRDAFMRVTDKPVLCVPLPLSEVGDSGLQREDFGIEASAFVFLTSFDFNSYVHRKNPHAVIEAFLQAFPPSRQDVQLLIKTSNGHRNPHRLRELLEYAARDGRVVVRDQVMDRADVQALQRCADVYVSLHHAEGFGLGLAECMAQGKPVIGTGWSGNMEFMDSDNSALVSYRLVPVREGEYPHHRGQRWAAADVADAARWMRRLADDPAFASELGRRARISVAQTLSPERAADALIARLQQIHRERLDQAAARQAISPVKGSISQNA